MPCTIQGHCLGENRYRQSNLRRRKCLTTARCRSYVNARVCIPRISIFIVGQISERLVDKDSRQATKARPFSPLQDDAKDFSQNVQSHVTKKFQSCSNGINEVHAALRSIHPARGIRLCRWHRKTCKRKSLRRCKNLRVPFQISGR